jgi:hypothetical protein
VTDADNREVLEYNGATGSLLNWYAYGGGSNAVLGQMKVPANARTTPVPDLLGSIVGSMDASTGTLTKFAYRPMERLPLRRHPSGTLASGSILRVAGCTTTGRGIIHRCWRGFCSPIRSATRPALTYMVTGAKIDELGRDRLDAQERRRRGRILLAAGKQAERDEAGAEKSHTAAPAMVEESRNLKPPSGDGIRFPN